MSGVKPKSSSLYKVLSSRRSSFLNLCSYKLWTMKEMKERGREREETANLMRAASWGSLLRQSYSADVELFLRSQSRQSTISTLLIKRQSEKALSFKLLHAQYFWVYIFHPFPFVPLSLPSPFPLSYPFPLTLSPLAKWNSGENTEDQLELFKLKVRTKWKLHWSLQTLEWNELEMMDRIAGRQMRRPMNKFTNCISKTVNLVMSRGSIFQMSTRENGRELRIKRASCVWMRFLWKSNPQIAVRLLPVLVLKSSTYSQTLTLFLFFCPQTWALIIHKKICPQQKSVE